MSDSRLLNENTIRRFMKLANVGPLTDNFISERAKKEEEIEEAFEEEETLEEETEEEADTLEEQEEDELAAAEEGEMDMDMDMDMDADLEEPEPGAADISLTEEEAQLLIDLGERLQAAMGDEEPEEEDVDAELADMDDDMGDMEAAGEEAPAKMYDDSPAMQESIVNEVLRRVTKRILASKKD